MDVHSAGFLENWGFGDFQFLKPSPNEPEQPIETSQLGRELAADGYLDARLLGLARRTGRYDEQDLKKVWHYVARFGGHARLAGGDA